MILVSGCPLARQLLAHPDATFKTCSGDYANLRLSTGGRRRYHRAWIHGCQKQRRRRRFVLPPTQSKSGYSRLHTPTPVISCHPDHNRNLPEGDFTQAADGIVITPSHNPPEDGGFKYNPPHGGPADTDVTQWIAERANRLLTDGNRAVRRLPLADALASSHVQEYDYIGPYVADLEQVIDFTVIRDAGIRLGADALGGAGLAYWRPIAERYGLDITIHNAHADATFRFMR